jgi:DNA polymerase-3 subunit gamma/tau
MPAVAPTPKPNPVPVSAKLIMEESAGAKIKKQPVAMEVREEKVAPTPQTSLGVLSRIREKVTRSMGQTDADALPLSDENIQKAWSEFVAKLEERKQHSSVTNFKMASVRAGGENMLEITVEGEFHKKFIEAERTELISHLRDFFRNKNIFFGFDVLPEKDRQDVEMPMSSREYFNKMAEQYPMVKILRDKLRLEIDI